MLFSITPSPALPLVLSNCATSHITTIHSWFGDWNWTHWRVQHWRFCSYSKAIWWRKYLIKVTLLNWTNVHLEERNKHTKKMCATGWLYLQDYRIKHYVTVRGDRIEYLNMLPVAKLSANSHTLISLYRLYSHTCCVAGKRLSQFIQTVAWWHVWQTGELCVCVWQACLIMLGRAVMVTSVMFIEGLLDQASRYHELDGRR